METIYKSLFQKADVSLLLLRQILKSEENSVKISDFSIVEANDRFLSDFHKSADDLIELSFSAFLGELSDLGSSLTTKFIYKCESLIKEKKEDFIFYADRLDRWFSLHLEKMEEDYWLIRVNEDVHAAINNEVLNELFIITEKYLSPSLGNIDYHQIAKDALQLSGAAYVLIQIFDLERNVTRTEALVGKEKGLRLGAHILGYAMEGKEYQITDYIGGRLLSEEISRMDSFAQLAEPHVSTIVVKSLIWIFHLGAVYTIGLKRLQKPLGAIIFLMEQGREIRDPNLLQIFGRTVSAYLHREFFDQEQKLLEQRIKENENLYRSVIENMYDMVCIADTNMVMLKLNQAHSQILGYALDELIGRSVMDFIHIEDLPSTRKKVAEVLQNQKKGSVFFRFRHKEGHYLWLETSGKKYIDAKNQTRILLITRDITAKKNAEMKLIENERQLMTLINAAPDIICLKDGEGRWLKANQAVIDLYKLNNVDYFMKTDRELLFFIGGDYQDWVDTSVESDQRAWHNRCLTRSVEKLFLDSDKEIIFDIIKVPVFHADGSRAALIVQGRDITEREATLVALQASEEHYRMLFEQSPIGILHYDIQGVITKVNDSFVRIFDSVREKLIGMKQLETIPNQKMVQAIRDSLTLGESFFEGEYTAVTSGKTVYLRAIFHGVRDRHNSIVGGIGILEDISERMAVVKEMERARLAAEEANRVKSQFLANMSHEIRTPMNAIIGMSDLALMAKTEAEKEEYLLTVKDAASHLVQVIGNILDLAHIESGKMTLNENAFCLKDLFQSMVNIYQHKAQQEEISFSYSFDSALPECVLGDSVKIRQIMFNLLGNAFKFSPKGLVYFGLSLYRKEEQKIGLRIIVRDTGIGIAQNDQKKIFSPFVQATQKEHSRMFGGSGLGLTIVREMLAMMNGNIQLKSELNKGSEFVVDFYLNLVQEKDLEYCCANKKKQGFGITVRSLRILVAEDNPVNTKLIERALKSMGHSVGLAADGQICLEKLQQEKFDLVLMDIEMPRLDGIEATKKIRAGEANAKSFDNQDIPIIALTAHAISDIREKALHVGINDYITKPIDLNHLAEKLNDFAKNH